MCVYYVCSYTAKCIYNICCVLTVLGSTVEVEIVFEYSLVHTYSMNEQTGLFIEELITVISNISGPGVNKYVNETIA